MRTHELEIVGQAPHPTRDDEMDGRGSQHRIVVVHQLRQRVLGVARPALHDQVRDAHLLRDRRVVENRQHALSDVALEQIVEVLDGRGPAARGACSMA